MYSYNPYYDRYLAHHGVKGMKWGIRRYQNPDGTLTEKGRKRQQRKETKQEYKQFNKDYENSKKSYLKAHKLAWTREKVGYGMSKKTYTAIKDDLKTNKGYSDDKLKKLLKMKAERRLAAAGAVYLAEKTVSKILSNPNVQAAINNALNTTIENHKFNVVNTQDASFITDMPLSLIMK